LQYFVRRYVSQNKKRGSSEQLFGGSSTRKEKINAWVIG